MMIAPSVSPTGFPIKELEDIDAAIEASMRAVEILTVRRDALREQLDVLTRPAPKPALALVDRRPRFEYRGSSYANWSNVDVYLELLRRLWNDLPGRREAMATAISRLGTQRNYVATGRDLLFFGKTKTWARRHSRGIVDGWFADTNLNVERMSKIVRAAAGAAQLDWGKDISVHWR